MDLLFENRLLELRTLVQDRIGTIFSKTEPVTLYGPMKYAVKVGGKLVRPVLLLLSNEAVGGDINNAINAATALEMVHNFSLVHDDIMDNDDLRRGRETVHKKWDNNIAILSGDALLVKAYQLMGLSDPEKLPRVLSEFSNGIFEVCEGQAFDKEFEERDNVSIEEYFNMIDKKTAKLLSVSCEIGAILGTENNRHIDALKNYGMYLGRAFQIQDDLLDIVADQNVLGKNVGSDLEENKKSFIILHAQENAKEKDRHFLESVLSKPNLSPVDVDETIALFNKLGTIKTARDYVGSEIKRAFDELAILPSSKAKDYLVHYLDYIKNRNY